jgi:hypothetical protein
MSKAYGKRRQARLVLLAQTGLHMSFLFYSVSGVYGWAPSSFVIAKRDMSVVPLSIQTRCSAAAGSDSSSENQTSEAREMKDLILSLSKERTDDSRRQRMQRIFTEAFSRPNGDPQRFTHLFDQQLIILGDQVKAKAAAMAIDLEQEADTHAISTEQSLADNEAGKMREKSAEEKQLWALVDMMVQSKTIVKRASGDLGSKGRFG